jgi:Asp-tRNA(Asn)/Glu-tRNA(Gln) amidotransferase A subunit family amidase
VSPEFSALCDRGEEISNDLYQAALATRATLRTRLESLFRDTDAILTLSATGEAPPTLESTGEPTFCSTWSVCGVPALAFPTALGPSGLPIGIQLVGRDRGDQALLDVAAWCREQLPKIVPPALDARAA